MNRHPALDDRNSIVVIYRPCDDQIHGDGVDGEVAFSRPANRVSGSGSGTVAIDSSGFGLAWFDATSTVAPGDVTAEWSGNAFRVPIGSLNGWDEVQHSGWKSGDRVFLRFKKGSQTAKIFTLGSSEHGITHGDQFIPNPRFVSTGGGIVGPGRNDQRSAWRPGSEPSPEKRPDPRLVRRPEPEIRRPEPESRRPDPRLVRRPEPEIRRPDRSGMVLRGRGGSLDNASAAKSQVDAMKRTIAELQRRLADGRADAEDERRMKSMQAELDRAREEKARALEELAAAQDKIILISANKPIGMPRHIRHQLPGDPLPPGYNGVVYYDQGINVPPSSGDVFYVPRPDHLSEVEDAAYEGTVDAVSDVLLSFVEELEKAQ